MYNPQKKLLAGIRQAFPLQWYPWDHYFITMAQGDYLAGRADVMSAKSYFTRTAPFNGAFCVLGGITDALRTISELRFDYDEFAGGLLDMGLKPEFVEWLKKRERLQLEIYAPPEGTIFFPNEPIVTMRGPLPDIRLAEGIITEAMNFATLSLTKWSRLTRVIQPGQALEFARRRSQNHMKATLYAMLGGCSTTSNAEMRRFFDFWVVGTMGHEWIQSFGDVAQAFDVWLEHNPDKPIGLVDTKRTMQHDFPLWLEAVWNRREAIKNADPAIWGWRNDSGDLAYLTIEQYVQFLKHPLSQDPWFKEKMRILLTNELDEYSASSIISQIVTEAKSAGLDENDILSRIVWAAGTNPGVCNDQPAIGGVAKLMEVEDQACIKLAFDHTGRPGIKTSIPGDNRSALIYNKSDQLECVLIYRNKWAELRNGKLYDNNSDESEIKTIEACHPNEESVRFNISDYRAVPQQSLVYDSLSASNSSLTNHWRDQTIAEVQHRIKTGISALHWSTQRIEKPHPVKVSLTSDLFELRRWMIQRGVLSERELL